MRMAVAVPLNKYRFIGGRAHDRGNSGPFNLASVIILSPVFDLSPISQPPTMRALRFCPLLAFVLTVGCRSAAPPADSQLVAQWLRTSLAFVRSERVGPPVATRISAYSAVALYEGYASDTRSTLRSLAGQLNGLATLPAPPPDGSVDGPTVAAEAERIVADSLFRDGLPSTRRTIDSLAAAQVEARSAAGIGTAQRLRSMKHGRALGAAILAWAATDSFFATRGRPYVPSGKREAWSNTANISQFVPQILSSQSDLVQFANSNDHEDAERASTKGTFTNRPKPVGVTTLPSFDPMKPTEPWWGNLRTFVLADGNACPPPPPPAYSEQRNSEFWRMGKQFYDSVKTLTPAQKTIALFWADNPIATGTPGFHWISVVNLMVGRRQLDAERAVELYTLTSLAIADAFIGCWREKYRSNVVRPVAYVQRVFDQHFQTVIPTPPFPEYTSGHSVQSAAAVEVLTALLGDTVAFIDSTQVDIGQPPRHFASFRAALDEVAMSRVYAGVHYFPAVLLGVEQGKCIGRTVLRTLNTRKQL